MDDRKVFKLKRLELAYEKQLRFMSASLALALIGVVVYVATMYRQTKASLTVSIVLMVAGAVCAFAVDNNMKDISHKIKEME